MNSQMVRSRSPVASGNLDGRLEPLENLDIAGNRGLLDESNVGRAQGAGELDQVHRRQGTMGVEDHDACRTDAFAFVADVVTSPSMSAGLPAISRGLAPGLVAVADGYTRILSRTGPPSSR